MEFTMKLFKTVLITLLSLLVTGCYTQLQYSQTMKKVTDEKQSEETGVYAWNGEEEEEQAVQKEGQPEDEQYAESESEEEYIPVYYKDYEYATKYGDVYNVNNHFSNDWYAYKHYRPYSSFRSHYSWSPFYYDRWHHHSFFGYGYHRPAFGMSFSIGWGSPYYRGFHDPFFDPYFDYYWYRHHSPYANNYRYFYGKSGYGHGYYPDKKVRQDENTRYGPRSIGTNRVASDSNRSRSVTDGRAASVSKSSSSTVRTRSTGTLRTRSSENHSKGKSTTQRARNNNRIDSSSSDVYLDRTRGEQRPVVIDEKQLKQIRSRLGNTGSSDINRSRLGNERKETPTFFNRMKDFFQESANSTIRTRSTTRSTNRAKVNRNSSTNRSSVTKSKSSSSNTRSRGSSSSSRSRSDNSGSSSSDSDRSRDS